MILLVVLAASMDVYSVNQIWISHWWYRIPAKILSILHTISRWSTLVIKDSKDWFSHSRHLWSYLYVRGSGSGAYGYEWLGLRLYPCVMQVTPFQADKMSPWPQLPPYADVFIAPTATDTAFTPMQSYSHSSDWSDQHPTENRPRSRYYFCAEYFGSKHWLTLSMLPCWRVGN